MKSKIVIPLCLLLILVGSSFVKKSNIKIVKAFHRAYNSRNHKLIKKVLSPQLVTINHKSDTMSTDRKSYFDLAINSTEIFGTKWKINEISEKGNKVFTIEEDSSLLLVYMYSKPLKFKYRYTVENQKITEIKYFSISNQDKLDERAIKRFDTLVEWIRNKYPNRVDVALELTKEGGKELISLLEEYLDENSKKT